MSSFGQKKAHFQANITSLQNKNSELKEKLSTAENKLTKLSTKENQNPLIYDKQNHYYTDSSANLYCPKCYQSNKKRTHIVPNGNPLQYWHCPVCDHTVNNPNYQPPRQAYSDDSSFY